MEELEIIEVDASTGKHTIIKDEEDEVVEINPMENIVENSPSEIDIMGYKQEIVELKKRLTILEGDDNDIVVVVSARARATLSSGVLISPGDDELIEFNTTTYDVGSNFNTTTHEFVAPNDGYYDVCMDVRMNITASGKQIDLYIKRNGVKMSTRTRFTAASGYQTFEINDTVYCSAGQTIEGYIKHDCSGDISIVAIDAGTFMTINEL